MKTILLCGNGMSGEVIGTIKSWGYKVALISEFPNDVGTSDADFYIEANSKDPEAALGAVEKLTEGGVSIDGVISLCWDSAMSVATIANKLGLFSVSLESALKSTMKDKRSDAFSKCGIPAPAYAVVSSYDQLVHIAKRFEFPLILKPVDQSSSKGVVKVHDMDSLSDAFMHCKKFTDCEKIILNEYLTGSEHSAEGLMIGGKLHMSAVSDRVFSYEEYDPYFIEVGDVMPTMLPPEIITELHKLVERAALSLGISDGVVKGDLVYNADSGLRVLEITARLGGPRFGTEMVPLSNGTNILKAAVQQALGENIDISLLVPKFSRGMVNRSIFPEPGVIKNVSDLNCLHECAGFYSFKWWGRKLELGDRIIASQNGCGGVAYFIVQGATRDEALARADNLERHIKIHTEPR
ncbi:ATP-grasp domain-containing protein [Pseudomonas sp. R1-7]|uniref:ATP-grasp domain-containing protein n=1 Tax=Pseudomonas sp. R1-7 TaxID=2817398 RepID=UPI003DA820DD